MSDVPAVPHGDEEMSAATSRPSAERSVPLPTSIRARQQPAAVEETSAGGLVVDDSAEPAQVALIGRLDRRGRLVWSLPKGHIEVGETAEQAALREVEEETGVRGHILQRLGTIDFWFVAGGRRVHKTVHHFLMRYVAGALNADDAEVVAVEWVPLDQVESRLAYADERRLFRLVPGLLANHG